MLSDQVGLSTSITTSGAIIWLVLSNLVGLLASINNLVDCWLVLSNLVGLLASINNLVDCLVGTI